MKTNEKNTCPQCGSQLQFDAPAGLCPACVMIMNLATPTLMDEEGSAHNVKFEVPELKEIIPLFQQLEIIELLGKGGMGVVYKARQKQLDRFVALKILPREIGAAAGFSERFAREAQALGKLNHPNIVTLYEFGNVERAGGDPLYYFLMEYVDGLNLRQLLGNGRVEPREALAIVPQICDALQYAHDQGIVHRDIKPENILLDRRGSVKVADFGLAKIVGTKDDISTATKAPSTGDHQSTIGHVIMGTPKYMSPEQMDAPGTVDHRADIYALGVVFYQMLTHEMPDEDLQPPSKKVRIDVRLDEVVLRALEEKPDHRYQQASTLKTQVETIMKDDGANTDLKPGLSSSGRKRLLFFLAAVLVVLIGLSFIFSVQDPGQAISLVELSNRPHLLKQASTEQVIEAGLQNVSMPWAWLELKRRLDAGRLTDRQVALFVESFVGLLERDYPYGHTSPLFSLGSLLRAFSDAERLSAGQEMEILMALQGALTVSPLPRVREGDKTIEVFVKWKAMHDHKLFGLVMLNRLESIVIDGTPAYIPSVNIIDPRPMGEQLPVPLPPLDPGEYTLEATVLSAWVKEGGAALLGNETTSADWPTAEKIWTRTCRDIIQVFDEDKPILGLIDDPAVDPVAAGMMGIEAVNINSVKGGSGRVASFKFRISKGPVPVSADVFLTLDEKTYPCGKLWAFSRENGYSHSGQVKRVELPGPDLSVTTATITLKPNPAHLEKNSEVDAVWNREIVFNDVPVVRYDADPFNDIVTGDTFAGLENAPKKPVIVSVSAEGAVEVKGIPYTLEQLKEELKHLVESGADAVLIRSAQKSRQERVLEVMTACQIDGIIAVHIAVNDKEGAGSNPFDVQ